MSLQDLTLKVNKKESGANGMTAEQVVRAALIKQMEGYSYHELAFHIVDSRCYRNFCKIGIAQKGFKKSALCQNINAISPKTWEAINKVLVKYAADAGIEKGRKVRIDCTVVSSDIHEPTDSSLLWDSVRVIAQILTRAKKELPGLCFPCRDTFYDHKVCLTGGSSNLILDCLILEGNPAD